MRPRGEAPPGEGQPLEAQAPGWRWPLGVFLVALAVTVALFGNRFVLTNDEGIILDSANRMARGEVPYRDFFGYMSPGSFWLQAAVFRLFGVTYAMGRILTLVDFAIHCAVLFALVQALASRRAAIVATGLFFAFQTADPTFLTAQHRWDSSALSLLSIALVVLAPQSNLLMNALVPGALAVFAAWCTPSVALPGLVTMGWLLFRDRPRFVGFAVGGLVVSAAAAANLLIGGNFQAFVAQLAWLQKNYSTLNVMPYGSVIGGYGPLLDGKSVVELGMQMLLVTGIALPAILPAAAVLGWVGLRGWRNAKLTYLAAAMVALVVTAFPRADLFHLAFVAVLPYALTAYWLTRVRWAAVAVVPMSAIAAMFFGYTLQRASGHTTLETSIGPVRVAAANAGALRGILRQVSPKHSLYVHPYMPVLYTLTQARNPTRFCYLMPGLMTPTDEGHVLGSLEADPPDYVAFLAVSDAEFLRVFPSAAGVSARFGRVESWIVRNYEPDGPSLSGYQLMRRKRSWEVAVSQSGGAAGTAVPAKTEKH